MEITLIQTGKDYRSALRVVSELVEKIGKPNHVMKCSTTNDLQGNIRGADSASIYMTELACAAVCSPRSMDEGADRTCFWLVAGQLG